MPILGARLLDVVLADAIVRAVAAQGRDAGFQLAAVQRDALAGRAAGRPRALGALGIRHAPAVARRATYLTSPCGVVT